jgi:hypothetical protein
VKFRDFAKIGCRLRLPLSSQRICSSGSSGKTHNSFEFLVFSFELIEEFVLFLRNKKGSMRCRAFAEAKPL